MQKTKCFVDGRTSRLEDVCYPLDDFRLVDYRDGVPVDSRFFLITVVVLSIQWQKMIFNLILLYWPLEFKLQYIMFNEICNLALISNSSLNH